MNLYLDIESIPSQHPDALAQVRATIKPPATLKKPESIAAWWETEADAAAEEAYRRQSLDGGLAGEIVSIAAVTGDGRQWVRCRTQGEAEGTLLTDFGEAVTRWIDEDARAVADGFNYAQDPYLVAHNAAFDLGFLWRRAIVNKVRLPFNVPAPSARAGKDYGCTMLAWAGYGNRVSLDALCRALGIPSPKEAGIDGAGVFDAWQAGRHEEIAQYNLRDALATAEVRIPLIADSDSILIVDSVPRDGGHLARES